MKERRKEIISDKYTYVEKKKRNKFYCTFMYFPIVRFRWLYQLHGKGMLH